MEKAKPAEMLVVDFKAKLVALVNSCGLPPFVAEMAISEVHSEISALARAQYEEAKRAYEAKTESGS